MHNALDTATRYASPRRTTAHTTVTSSTLPLAIPLTSHRLASAANGVYTSGRTLTTRAKLTAVCAIDDASAASDAEREGEGEAGAVLPPDDAEDASESSLVRTSSTSRFVSPSAQMLRARKRGKQSQLRPRLSRHPRRRACPSERGDALVRVAVRDEEHDVAVLELQADDVGVARQVPPPLALLLGLLGLGALGRRQLGQLQGRVEEVDLGRLLVHEAVQDRGRRRGEGRGVGRRRGRRGRREVRGRLRTQHHEARVAEAAEKDVRELGGPPQVRRSRTRGALERRGEGRAKLTLRRAACPSRRRARPDTPSSFLRGTNKRLESVPLLDVESEPDRGRERDAPATTPSSFMTSPYAPSSRSTSAMPLSSPSPSFVGGGSAHRAVRTRSRANHMSDCERGEGGGVSAATTVQLSRAAVARAPSVRR